MSEIVWQAPPDRPGATTTKNEIIRALKSRPGEWALVATAVYTSRAAAFRRAGCEATTRNQMNGKCDLYARWPVEAVS